MRQLSVIKWTKSLKVNINRLKKRLKNKRKLSKKMRRNLKQKNTQIKNTENNLSTQLNLKTLLLEIKKHSNY